MKKPLVFCLAVSHMDLHLAKLWLQWAVYLSSCKGGDVSDIPLIVSLTKRAWHEGAFTLSEITASAGPGFFRTRFEVCADENEIGYPGSSSHLFCRSLQSCNLHYPGHAVMFCEADSVPMRPDWAVALQDDYQQRKQPFVGVFIPSTHAAIHEFGFPAFHLTGNAIYPHNARELAPSIEQCLVASTEDCPWKEKGWAWDLFCAHEIMPQAEQTPLIQQLWRPPVWTAKMLNWIKPQTALYHQCKDGSLIIALASERYPGFFDTLPAAESYYMLETSPSSVTLGAHAIKFRPAYRGSGGGIVSILAPDSSRDEMSLSVLAGTRGISRISKEDYLSLSQQADTNRLDR